MLRPSCGASSTTLPVLRRCGRWLALACLGLAGCNGPHAGEAVGPPAASSTAPAFTEVTDEAGLGGFRHVTGAFGLKWFPEPMGSGGGFLDYDGDGWLDVMLVGGGTWPGHADRSVPALRLYRNRGDGTFEETTREAGLGGLSAYGFGITAADYDNDGDQDVFVTTLYENLLLRNDGGTFTEVGRQAGLAGASEWSTAALFFDADRDGHLDLYVGNYVVWSPEQDLKCTRVGQTKSYCTPELYTGLPGAFYHNNGDGTFTDRSEAAGFRPAPGKTLGAAELDFNRDGRPDVFVANDTQRDLLFENRGDGTFEEQGVFRGVAFDENGRARAGMGVDAGVVDSTGQETVFVANFSSEMVGVYRHAGDGLFIDRAAVSGIGQPSLLMLTFGLILFDADLDTDLDLLTANGHIAEDIGLAEEGVKYRQTAQLFLNRGDGVFDAFKATTGVFTRPMVARAAAYADYDRDGDLDVLITENGGPVHLWRNDLDGGRFLRVRLEGRQSNRDALGSRVVAVVDGLRMERRIRTGSSYLSQSEKAAVFGLGASTRVDTLWVYWPGGSVDHFEGVEANQELRIVEGAGSFEALSGLAWREAPGAGR